MRGTESIAITEAFRPFSFSSSSAFWAGQMKLISVATVAQQLGLIDTKIRMGFGLKNLQDDIRVRPEFPCIVDNLYAGIAI